MNPIPASLNHVALDVHDRERSAGFYRGLLGTTVVATDEQHGISFLRLPGSQHFSDLALHAHPDREAAYPSGQMRLAHTGWSVDDPAYLVEAYQYFTEHSRVLFAADFGVSVSVMGMDPDGNVVEFELFRVGAEDVAPGFEPLDLDHLRSLAAPAAASGGGGGR